MPLKFRLSERANKKYDVWVPQLQKWVSFGDNRYSHYKTSSAIPKSLHVFEEHRDLSRRANYRRRAGNIKNAAGELTVNDPTTANYYAYHYLW